MIGRRGDAFSCRLLTSKSVINNIRRPAQAEKHQNCNHNFIFHMKEDVEYFTVLVARDAKGVVTPLSHFRWVIDYDARVRWRGGNPVAVQRGAIRFDLPVQGGPGDADVSSLLLNPKPPHTNDIHKEADKKAVTNKPPTNFSENTQWFVNVPREFGHEGGAPGDRRTHSCPTREKNRVGSAGVGRDVPTMLAEAACSRVCRTVSALRPEPSNKAQAAGPTPSRPTARCRPASRRAPAVRCASVVLVFRGKGRLANVLVVANSVVTLRLEFETSRGNVAAKRDDQRQLERESTKRTTYTDA